MSTKGWEVLPQELMYISALSKPQAATEVHDSIIVNSDDEPSNTMKDGERAMKAERETPWGT